MSAPVLLNLRGLRALGINYSRQWLWKLEDRGAFPKRVALGEKSVAWVESEIHAWLEAKIAERGK